MSKTFDCKNYYFEKRIFVDEIEQYEEGWCYIVTESPGIGTVHRYFYHSKNLLALQRHHDALIASLENEKEASLKSGFWKPVRVKPTLLEQLKAKNNEKTR